MSAQPFILGQHVSFRCLTGERVFRGTLLAFLDDRYAVVDDHLGLRPRIVRRDRLSHPGSIK